MLKKLILNLIYRCIFVLPVFIALTGCKYHEIEQCHDKISAIKVHLESTERGPDKIYVLLDRTLSETFSNDTSTYQLHIKHKIDKQLMFMHKDATYQQVRIILTLEYEMRDHKGRKLYTSNVTVSEAVNLSSNVYNDFVNERYVGAQLIKRAVNLLKVRLMRDLHCLTP